MARRNLVDIDTKIIQAVMQIAAEEGINNVTASKVANICEISHFTCFQHFGTKNGMIRKAAETFDRQYMAMLKDRVAQNPALDVLFDEMLDAFLQNPTGAIFYNNYVLEVGFDPTTQNERSGEFLEMAKLLFRNVNLTDDQTLILWDYVTSMAFYYAEKIIHGYLKNTPDVRSLIKTILLNGIESFEFIHN